jgi:hypothetical protein
VTGKSWLIRHELHGAQVFNLLDSAIYDRFIRRPSAFAEEINHDLGVGVLIYLLVEHAHFICFR